MSANGSRLAASRCAAAPVPVLALALASAVLALALGCSGPPKAAAYLNKLSGDGQVGVAGVALPQPLVVKVTDNTGDGVSGIIVVWTVLAGGGAVSTSSTSTGPDGTATTTATLGPSEMESSFQATVYGIPGSPAIFKSSRSPFKLSYTDPGAAGKLRLVKGAAATDSSVTLDLVVAPGASLSGYSAGFNLPLDAAKVALDPAAPLLPGKVLDPGTAPTAALAALPSAGPLKGVLVTGLSQKASGAGAVMTDSMLAAGSVIYSIKLNLQPTATPGVVFDGTASGFRLSSGGLRSRIGTAVVNPQELAIGKLEVVK